MECNSVQWIFKQTKLRATGLLSLTGLRLVKCIMHTHCKMHWMHKFHNAQDITMHTLASAWDIA